MGLYDDDIDSEDELLERSRFLREVMDRCNAELRNGIEPDIERIFREVISDAELIAPDLINATLKSTSLAIRRSQRVSHQIRRRMLSRFGESLESFEDCVNIGEVVVRSQTDSIWRRDTTGEAVLKVSTIAGISPDLVGGALAKCMLLNSLSSQSVLCAAEIYSLLGNGYAEGATARARTMYEVAVIVDFLAVHSLSQNSYEVTDRFHVYAAIEDAAYRRKFTSNVAPLYEDVTGSAVRKWGPSIKDPYGWAVPVLTLSGKQRPTLRDLEMSLSLKDRRHLYFEWSQAVHASSAGVVARTRFRGPYPNRCRAEFEPSVVNRVLWASASLLEETLRIATRSIASEAKAWDGLFSLHPLNRAVERTILGVGGQI